MFFLLFGLFHPLSRDVQNLNFGQFFNQVSSQTEKGKCYLLIFVVIC